MQVNLRDVAAIWERGVMSGQGRRQLAFAALFAVLVVGVVANLQLLSRALAELPKLTDAELIERYASRFAGVKALLPRTGTVGYLSDREPRDAVTDPYGVGYYYLTQYTLAPIIVSQSLEPSLIVGNFEQPSVATTTAAAHQLTAVKDFGDGVLLLHRP